eukprot:3074399-Pyramimonas_sp.AAC.1
MDPRDLREPSTSTPPLAKRTVSKSASGDPKMASKVAQDGSRWVKITSRMIVSTSLGIGFGWAGGHLCFVAAAGQGVRQRQLSKIGL